MVFLVIWNSRYVNYFFDMLVSLKVSFFCFLLIIFWALGQKGCQIILLGFMGHYYVNFLRGQGQECIFQGQSLKIFVEIYILFIIFQKSWGSPKLGLSLVKVVPILHDRTTIHARKEMSDCVPYVWMGGEDKEK